MARQHAKNIQKLFQQGRQVQQERQLQQRTTHGNLAVNPFDHRKSGLLPGRLHQQQEAQRKTSMLELQKIQKILNERGLMQQNRERLPKEQKELFDLRMLFYNALSEGKIRNFQEFQQYLKKFLMETHRNPQQATEYSVKAYWKFMRSLTNKQRETLGINIKNLAIIARGGDPYD